MIYNDDIHDLRLPKFNILELKTAYEKLTSDVSYTRGKVNGILLNKVPESDTNDPRGIFWILNKDGVEKQREAYVDESQYTDLIPEIKSTYFETIYNELSKYYILGRMRILLLEPRKCLSFHRDPEPRLHIPIISSPGALMIVDDFCTHMPADGTTYYMNTEKYHGALNGSEEDRVHLVATVLKTK
jgi:hypothetical protein